MSGASVASHIFGAGATHFMSGAHAAHHIFGSRARATTIGSHLVFHLKGTISGPFALWLHLRDEGFNKGKEKLLPVSNNIHLFMPILVLTF